ncbi:MAG: ADP-glyceromanno-heptose 6-epimerase [Verrucomicrobiota bacterium]
MAKKILVTGGAGFVGSNLALTLQERFPKHDLIVIDDFRSGHFRNLEGFKGDFIARDLSQVCLTELFGKTTFDAIFHLSSITDTTEHDQYKQTYDNVESLRHILKFIAGKKTSLVYASSAATYGIAAGVNRLSDPRKPANVYGFSKVQLENLSAQFLREHPTQKVVGLRYFNVYGPRETHKKAAASMTYQLAHQMLQGKSPRVFKHGEQKRDFVYVKDIVEFTIAGFTKAKKSGVYNAGSGKPRSFNDIIQTLNKVLNLKIEADYFDNPYPFYQPHTEADLTQTKKELKTEPQYTLEKGIEDYFKSGWLTLTPPKV